MLRVISGYLDVGEASALALALENPNSILILDDLKGSSKTKNTFHRDDRCFNKSEKRKKITNLDSYFDELKEKGFTISDNILELAKKLSK